MAPRKVEAQPCAKESPPEGPTDGGAPRVLPPDVARIGGEKTGDNQGNQPGARQLVLVRQGLRDYAPRRFADGRPRSRATRGCTPSIRHEPDNGHESLPDNVGEIGGANRFPRPEARKPQPQASSTPRATPALSPKVSPAIPICRNSGVLAKCAGGRILRSRGSDTSRGRHSDVPTLRRQSRPVLQRPPQGTPGWERRGRRLRIDNQSDFTRPAMQPGLPPEYLGEDGAEFRAQLARPHSLPTPKRPATNPPPSAPTPERGNSTGGWRDYVALPQQVGQTFVHLI